MDWLTWPLVGLVLGVLALLIFRGPLVKKLGSLRKAGRDGVQFDPQQDQATEASRPETLPSGLGGDSSKTTPESSVDVKPSESAEGQSFDELMTQPITATVLDRERLIRDRFKDLKFEPAQRETLLVRALASVNIELEFSRSAHLIFGSQLSLLLALVGKPTGISRDEAVAIFEEAKTQWPDLHAARTFEVWLQFLKNGQLVGEDRARIDITQAGSDFLKFLVDLRLGHERAG